MRRLFLVSLLLMILLLNSCRMINVMMPKDSRPGKIKFISEKISDADYNLQAHDIIAQFGEDFKHIDIFRENGIREYKGPETCLQCHEKINVKDHMTGEDKNVDLMKNLLSSAHYTFFTKEHKNVWGFNGELADNFPMGKIDRPCPKPGSFAMTAWAELVILDNGDTLSEGCGQCHIGGQYQAPLGEMMPGYRTLQKEKDAIDCLICHSAAYEMNEKQVVQDSNGLKRWTQDRSMKAAMTVTAPTNQTCLRCHQHNYGGDIYIDEADSSFMQSLINTGHERPRVLHPGSKRGTPFSPTWDVHAAAGVNCIDCHTTEGHLMAKGKHTTTMMANDLPEVEVQCQSCHGDEPHSENEELADYFNMHIEKIACQTCHIPSLHEDNATMRDFAHTEFEEDPGIYIYHDIEKKTQPGDGIVYKWWNGDATFLGNPIGDNPNGKDLYSFYKPEHIWPEYKDFDYEAWYENVMRPIAKKKPSKLYAMKRFNGRQHIDLQNMGPFGGMFVPYNLPEYYTSGNPDSAAAKEMDKSMMKMMYGVMFDQYLMNRFMTYMDDGSGNYLKGWDTKAYDDV
ncbi:MAG: hypothetical protein KAI81_06865, partial [Candidatus Marinimicrobia bacterium]|nr:hypothetical protein [Candidatus Neomarinimicrobiota bacterium]